MKLEEEKNQLKNWISQYIVNFKKHKLENKVFEYETLRTSIDFSLTDKSIEKVEHLFKIRNEIELHIKTKNFDKKYKKLNEKLVYNMEKFIKNIYMIDIMSEGNIFRIGVFDKEDLVLHNKFLGIKTIDIR